MKPLRNFILTTFICLDNYGITFIDFAIHINQINSDYVLTEYRKVCRMSCCVQGVYYTEKRTPCFSIVERELWPRLIQGQNEEINL